MQQHAALIVFAGLIAGAFPLVKTGPESMLGLYLYIPPLFVGLALGTKAVVFSCAIAFALATVLGGGNALGDLLACLLPVIALTHMFMRYRQKPDGTTEWYPPLYAISNMAMMAAAVFMMIALSSNSLSEQAVFDAVKQLLMPPDRAGIDPKKVEVMETQLREFGFILVALFCWLLVMLPYVLAVAVNHLLALRGRALRPHITLTQARLPVILPVLLAVCAVLALIGNGNDRFASSVVFLILLLPYEFSGLVLLHHWTRNWGARPFWLSLVYILLILNPLLNIGAILTGFYMQLRETLDKPRQMG